jgi:cell wall-associated NlpC family hydrolase
MTLEKRTHAYRADLADENLRGQVEAAQFVTSVAHQIIAPIATLYRTPSLRGRQETQGLFGETCKVFDEADGFAFVQLDHDRYVGYVLATAISAEVSKSTHWVSVPSTFIYPEPDIKTQIPVSLFLNSQLTVIETVGNFVRLAGGGFVFAHHVEPLSVHEADFVAGAERYLHVPYLWGGKSVHGLDCSGLVQVSLHAAGKQAPRDADMQEGELGKHLMVNDLDNLQRGDLVFWSGHVGIMQNETMLLHANGHHMLTVSEPLQDAIARIAKTAGMPTSLKRL